VLKACLDKVEGCVESIILFGRNDLLFLVVNTVCLGHDDGDLSSFTTLFLHSLDTINERRRGTQFPKTNHTAETIDFSPFQYQYQKGQPQRQTMIDAIVRNALELVQDPYGN